MISVVDYGAGNIRSVERAFAALGFQARLVSTASEVRDSLGIVIPGVGSFGNGMANLMKSGLDEAIRELAFSRPILGICLGMQLLFESSAEGGDHRGLALLRGKVVPFKGGTKVPHMGWNRVEFLGDHPIIDGVSGGTHFYFAHSFTVLPDDGRVVLGMTEYGGWFPSIVTRGTIMGVQFHPEKSGRPGLKVLRNFGVMVSGRNPGD